ncbi:MAG: delta-60 repeat domain-containing protein [Verrucomicrobiota bacterium]
MKNSRLPPLIFFLIVLPIPLQARPGTLLPAAPELLTSARITAQLPLPDGGHLLASTYKGGTNSGILQKLGADGSLDGTWSTPLTVTSIIVDSMRLLPDGRIWLEAGNNPASFPRSPFEPPLMPRFGWLVLNADGSRNAGAFPSVPHETSLRLLYFSDTAVTFCMCRQADYGTRLAADRLIRFRLSDGSPDPQFRPALPEKAEIVDAAPTADGRMWLLTMEFAPDGSSNHNDSYVYTLRRLLADGSPDPGFTPRLLERGFTRRMESSHSPGGIRISALRVSSYNIQPGGNQQSPFEITWLDAAGGITRKENFHAGRQGYLPLRLLEEPDGSLVGNFGSNGEIHRRRPDGGFDPALLLMTNSYFRSPVLHRLPDGKLLLEGRQRFLPDGSPDPGFTAPALPQPGSVTTLAPAANGGFYAQGDFITVNGQPRPGICRFKADGSLDSSFLPPADLGTIHSMQRLPEDQLLILHQPPPIPDPPGDGYGPWTSRQLSRLLPDGSLERIFSEGNYVSINAEVALPDGKILIKYTIQGEVPSTKIIRLRADGSQDPAFNGSALPGSWSNYDCAVFSDGRLLIQLKLFTPDGTPIPTEIPPAPSWLPRYCLGMLPEGRAVILDNLSSPPVLKLLDSSGKIDSTFQTTLPPHTYPRAIAGPGGKIYLTGWFPVPGGQYAHIRRLHRNGQTDPTFRGAVLRSRPPLPTGPEARLTFDSGGRLYSMTGTAGTAGTGGAALVHPATGILWLGGSFISANGQARSSLAALDTGDATGFDAWMLACAGEPAVSSADLETTADPDHDGQSNWLEYATGSDPFLSDAPSSSLTAISVNPTPTLAIQRNPEAADLQLTPEISDDLQTWCAATADEVSASTSGSRVAFTLNPVTSRRYLRARFTK